jgi:5-methylcytosine-specific restriction enzyme subunit McrC
VTNLATSTATLFEYERVNYEITSQTEKDHHADYSKPLHLTEEILNELEKINKTNNFLDIGRKTIKPLNYVGVVKTGPITIEILPKMFKSEYEKHRAVIARNLLKMLSYSELLPRNIDSADLDTEKLNFFEIFIYFFARNLNELIKSIQIKEYIKSSEELRFIKGRIDTRRYTNPARLHIVPCNYHEFSIDNTLNRTLKYTCYLMSRMVKTNDTFRLLRSIMGILDPITLSSVSLSEIDIIQFTRLNIKFKPFIRICRIFLSHSTLILRASDVETFSLLIPMEKLFEKFIAEVLKEDPDYFFGPETYIFPQQDIGNLANYEDGTRVFNLRPDIVIKKGPKVAIIDTKYKLLNDEDRKYGVPQADVYQMYAYVTKIDAISSMLLYPDTENKLFTFFYNIEARKKNVPLYIKSIKLSYDLTNEKDWAEFRKNLRNVTTSLFLNSTNDNGLLKIH